MPPRRPLSKREVADLTDQILKFRDGVHRLLAALKRLLR